MLEWWWRGGEKDSEEIESGGEALVGVMGIDMVLAWVCGEWEWEMHVTTEGACADVAGLGTRSQSRGFSSVGISYYRNNQRTLAWKWGLDRLTSSSTFLTPPSKWLF